MYKIRRIDPEDRSKTRKRLNAFLAKLDKKFKPEKIIVFGSYAKNDLNEGSDIDLLVVADFKEPFKERIGSMMELTKLPVEPLGYTPSEFKKIKSRPFIKEILRTGKDISRSALA